MARKNFKCSECGAMNDRQVPRPTRCGNAVLPQNEDFKLFVAEHEMMSSGLNKRKLKECYLAWLAIEYFNDLGYGVSVQGETLMVGHNDYPVSVAGALQAVEDLA